VYVLIAADGGVSISFIDAAGRPVSKPVTLERLPAEVEHALDADKDTYVFVRGSRGLTYPAFKAVMDRLQGHNFRIGLMSEEVRE
jgi:biopolymer transport protein ExbD